MPETSGCISSPTYAIAVAGNPLNASPESNRRSKNACQVGAKADAVSSRAAVTMETAMTGLRP